MASNHLSLHFFGLNLDFEKILKRIWKIFSLKNVSFSHYFETQKETAQTSNFGSCYWNITFPIFLMVRTKIIFLQKNI